MKMHGGTVSTLTSLQSSVLQGAGLTGRDPGKHFNTCLPRSHPMPSSLWAPKHCWSKHHLGTGTELGPKPQKRNYCHYC